MKHLLFEPKNITNLVIFRIAFGAIMLWEVVRYFEHGWIKKYWIAPPLNFPYHGFEWLQPWPGPGMYLHFYIMGLLALFIMLGFFYRLSTALFFCAFTHSFLLEQGRYLNHFYLVSLLSFLLIFVPANRKYALDSWFWKSTRSDYVPAWTIYLLAFQIGIAYFYGGFAKINYDWLILAEPMRHWLSEIKNFPLIGQYFNQAWMAYFMSWSGMFLDLLAPFFLSIRRTRPYMFAAILTFHFMNDRMFKIGLFPWFMIVASTLFFPADWLKKLIHTVWQNHKNQGTTILIGAFVFALIGSYFHIKADRDFEIMPFIVAGLGGGTLVWLFIDLYGQPVPQTKKIQQPQIPQFASKQVVLVLLTTWALIQMVVPLRHFFIPGKVDWTEEGHMFSWRMKLRDKESTISFVAYNPATGKSEAIDTGPYVKNWQITDMSTKPYMILQFAKFLDKKLAEQGKENYEVRVMATSSLNFRKYQNYIDPEIDLSKQSYYELRHNSWITPFDNTSKPAAITKEGQ